MPAMYSASVRQKDITEKILLELVSDNPDIIVVTDHVKSTPVKRGGQNILDIYYRKDAIRINISKRNTCLYNVYQQLFREGIAYQKDTASPGSTKGMFSFFVDENNVSLALDRLIYVDE